MDGLIHFCLSFNMSYVLKLLLIIEKKELLKIILMLNETVDFLTTVSHIRVNSKQNWLNLLKSLVIFQFLHTLSYLNEQAHMY